MVVCISISQTNFHFLAFDISDRQATEDAFHSLPATWQSIDLLVNNAGLGLGLESADKASLDDWMQMINTNIKRTRHHHSSCVTTNGRTQFRSHY